MKKRKCSIDNETLNVILDNCKEFLNKRNTIYLSDICDLLEKALENVGDKKDLSDRELLEIKTIRNMIKGL